MKYTSSKLTGILLMAAAMQYIFTSCTSTKKATYFNNQAEAVVRSSSSVPETVIRPKDILGISVSSLNPAASGIFNNANIAYSSSSPTVQNNQPTGYLVDSTGFIQFPMLGNISAAGKTSEALRKQIVAEITAKQLLADPIVTVRFLNYRVTVLGEVGRPSVINVPSEKISLLEALGLAGDITIYGRKDNVMIIRETQNEKIIKRVNLNSGDLFTSPYYYLNSNDIVYVEPNGAKVASSRQSTQLIPILLSALSFTAIIVTQVIRNNN